VPPPLPAKTILVVDDEIEVAEVLAEMLEADGHQVERAANGAQALERLGTGRYDLVLTDLKMPELDGPGLYREVERRDPGLLGRFVFLTGDTLSPEISDFLEQAGRPRLSKPFTPDEVRRAIAQALEVPAAASPSASTDP
jgi:CheY-like chemotaxis protein